MNESMKESEQGSSWDYRGVTAWCH